MNPVSVHLGLLAISKDPARASTRDIDAVILAATAAGHQIVARRTVADTEAAIGEWLRRWAADASIDCVIVLGGDSDAVTAALHPLVTQPVPGFTDLFRWLMFQERGASAMLSSAEAAQCGSTFVFVIPGAVAAAMDKLILPQFDPRTTPKNLVGQMPRLAGAVAPAEAAYVPEEIPPERTQGGPGLPARLPAQPAGRRAHASTGANVIRRGEPAAHAPDDPPTRPIDVARLEQHLAVTSGRGNHDVTLQTERVRPSDRDLETLDADVMELEPDEVGTSTAITPAAPARGRMLEAETAIAPPPTAADRARPVAARGAAAAARPATTPPAAAPARAKVPSVPAIPSVTAPGASGRARTGSAPNPAVTAASSAPPGRAREPSAPTPVAAAPSAPSGRARTGSAPNPAVTAASSAPPGRAREPSAPTPVAAAPGAPSGRAREPSAPAPVAAAPGAPSGRTREPSAPVAREPSAPVAREPAAPARTPTAPPPPGPGRGPLLTGPALADTEPLPAGAFTYRPAPRGMHPALKVLGAAAVVALGFGAGIYVLDRGRAAPAAATTAPVATAPDAGVAAADAAPAQVALTEDIELPPDDVSRTAPARPPAAGTTSARPAGAATARPRPATAPAAGATTPADGGPVTTPEPAAAPADEPADDAARPAASDCDEASCVLSNYDRPCCEAYRPKTAELGKRVGGTPASLDRTMVRAGMESIKPRVVACGEKAGVSGTVKVAVKVSPDGGVTDASVRATPDENLGDCVAGAIRSAKFGASVSGGAFTYPFVF